jgi:O-antigen/teichoic acid export membrane protein
VLINAPANIAFILLQARGYARWSAWLHLIELPLTTAALLLAVQRFGIEGAAWVWLLRIALDTAGMFYLARRLQPDIVSLRLVFGLIFSCAGALLLIVAANGAGGIVTRGALALLVVAVSAAILLERREFVSLCSTFQSFLRRR